MINVAGAKLMLALTTRVLRHGSSQYRYGEPGEESAQQLGY